MNILILLKRLWLHLSSTRRAQFVLLLLLMIIASIAEVITVGAIFPFLAVLADPDKVFANPSAKFFIEYLEVSSPRELLFPITIIFAFAALLSGSIRILLTWANIRFSFATGADLGVKIYNLSLHQPYSIQVNRNSAEIINGIIVKAGGLINTTITPLISIISSMLILIALMSFLVKIEPLISSLAFGCFGLIFATIIWVTRRAKKTNSERIAHESNQVVKALQEGLGGIRDVLIDGTQATYIDIYRKSDLSLRYAQGSNQIIALTPRFGVEALGIMLIAILAFYISQRGDSISTAIPVLGSLALGAQRMLPSMQLLYSSWSTIEGTRASLNDTLDLLDQPIPSHLNKIATNKMIFEKAIKMNNVSFRYNSQSPDILRNLDINIPKGSKVGFVGSTGSGKSTLLDILMGLLEPTEGFLLVDDTEISIQNHRSWQSNIAHVPQNIFLSDASIKENIAFGIPSDQIDLSKVKLCAEKAQILHTIESWSEGFNTKVGERGVRLSGGQRQRIGIARALYKQADVLVLDEATSALDNKTEQAITEFIDELSDDLTVIIVAHRLTTLKTCSIIFELDDGFIKAVGSYDDFISELNGIN